MNRRTVLCGLTLSTLAAPLLAKARQSPTIPRVGVMAIGSGTPPSPTYEAFRQGLRDLGWIEGQNIIVDVRWTPTVARLPEIAAEFVRMNVDVIFAASSTQVEPARQATKTIPIVFAIHADPIGVGHVASLARPGGNITGLAQLLTELSAKELELLKEALPQVTRIGVLWNPTTPSHPPALKAIEAAAETLRVRVQKARAGAFLVLASPLTYVQRARLAEVALRRRLPGMFGFRENVEAGGLMSYGPDLNDLFHRAATYVDKIVKGAKPANLPVEQASQFELVINLKTAKALGLRIPQSVLIRAAQIIE